MLRATLIGDEALAAKFQAAAATITGEETIWVGECGEIVMASIRENILEQRLVESGDLYNSGRTFYHTAHGISVGFGQGLDYAEAIELGAVEHEIAGNPLLAFWWVSRHERFVGPVVQHPGNVAYRYVYNGTYRSLTPILGLFYSKLRAVFGGM